MIAYVLDASVAAKWFLPAAHETLADEAMRVLDAYAAGQLRLLVLDLFWPEFGNILWRAVRSGRISRESAEKAIASLTERNLSTVDSASLVKDAFTIAAAFDRTVYDGTFAALAIAANAPLLTADERLANTLAARFPILWLGAI